MEQPLDIRIREVMPADAARLGEFFKANATATTLRHFSPFRLDEATARQIALEPRRDVYFAALLGDSFVGLSLLRGWDEGFDIPSFGMVIDERLRGKGVGRRLMEWTLGAAKQKGCSHVRLSVNASNRAGMHLYESIGFIRQSETPILVQGEPDVKIVMAMKLGQ